MNAVADEVVAESETNFNKSGFDDNPTCLQIKSDFFQKRDWILFTKKIVLKQSTYLDGI